MLKQAKPEPAPRVERGDVVDAATRIAGRVERTPLIETRVRGTKLWLKCECLQTGGSFKLRGATNRLMQLDDEQRRRGVVAFSSGNHALGVAIAARRLGIPATIVMPADAPRVKIEGTRGEGAQIVFYDRKTEDRAAIAAKLAAETGATVVPSFDDPMIVAGQGSVGLEIVEQAREPAVRIVIPCGGGGLASGIALACPDAEIVVVEPEGWDDMRVSLELGHIVPVTEDAPPNAVRRASDSAGVADHFWDSQTTAGDRGGRQRARGCRGGPVCLGRAPAGRRARRCRGARGAAVGQGRSGAGNGGGVVGWQCRFGAARSDRGGRSGGGSSVAVGFEVRI